MKTGVVAGFKDDFFFLSNFYEYDFEYEGYTWPTGEHAFQAAKYKAMEDAKLNDLASYIKKVEDAPTPAKAKYAGRSVTIDIKYWNEIKVSVMRDIIEAKFSVPELGNALLDTGMMMLVESNDWGDTFWGRCNGKGLNTLGVILIEQRGRLR